jgi:hypothetical protein
MQGTTEEAQRCDLMQLHCMWFVWFADNVQLACIAVLVLMCHAYAPRGLTPVCMLLLLLIVLCCCCCRCRRCLYCAAYCTAYCTAYCSLLAAQVSDAGGAAALSCLLQLRVLDLSCSSISSRGLLLLAPLRHLHSLNLDMCHIGDEACRVRRERGGGGRGLRCGGGRGSGNSCVISLNLDMCHIGDEACRVRRCQQRGWQRGGGGWRRGVGDRV